jgi:hypothetical protein
MFIKKFKNYQEMENYLNKNNFVSIEITEKNNCVEVIFDKKLDVDLFKRIENKKLQELTQ